jgi:hypothetical protein
MPRRRWVLRTARRKLRQILSFSSEDLHEGALLELHLAVLSWLAA